MSEPSHCGESVTIQLAVHGDHHVASSVDQSDQLYTAADDANQPCPTADRADKVYTDLGVTQPVTVQQAIHGLLLAISYIQNQPDLDQSLSQQLESIIRQLEDPHNDMGRDSTVIHTDGRSMICDIQLVDEDPTGQVGLHYGETPVEYNYTNIDHITDDGATISSEILDKPARETSSITSMNGECTAQNEIFEIIAPGEELSDFVDTPSPKHSSIDGHKVDHTGSISVVPSITELDDHIKPMVGSSNVGINYTSSTAGGPNVFVIQTAADEATPDKFKKVIILRKKPIEFGNNLTNKNTSSTKTDTSSNSPRAIVEKLIEKLIATDSGSRKPDRFPSDQQHGSNKNQKNSQLLQKRAQTYSDRRPFSCRICRKMFRCAREVRMHTTAVHVRARRQSCHLCNKQYNTIRGLKVHMLTHTASLTCHMCLKTFSNAYILKRHMTNHAEFKPSACPMCGKQFILKHELQAHIDQHATEPPTSADTTCLVCCKTFTNVADLKKHMQTHRRRCVCDICGKSISSRSQLKIHRRIHTGEKPFACDTCDKKFISTSKLKAHKQHHSSVRSFLCSQCGRSFMWKKGLQKHVNDKHSEDPKKYPCSLCGKELSSVNALTQHNLVIHSSEKPYTCDECGMSLRTAHALKQHVARSHVTDKQGACPECGKVFMYPPDLRRHMKIHQAGQHVCTVCQAAHTDRYQLERHMRIHTGEKPFSCLTCGKSYRIASQLTVHARIHTGEKPFACEFCSKTFRRSGQLSKHRETHKRSPPHVCAVCGQGFVRPVNLKLHMRKHKIA